MKYAKEVEHWIRSVTFFARSDDFIVQPARLFFLFYNFLAVLPAGDLPVVPSLDTGNASFGNEPVSAA